MKTYKEHGNDHDFFEKDHLERFLRNHKTGVDNLGRQALGRILGEYNIPKVLDIACGSCVNWETWKLMGIPCEYNGLDLTEGLLDVARNKYEDDKIELKQGYAQDVDQYYSDDSMDVVILRHILEHVYNGEYEEIVRKAFNAAKSELIIVFFLEPHKGTEHVIEERSSNIDGHPEITHYWNEYSWGKLSEFFATLGCKIKTQQVYTPGAAHIDTIVRLIK